jgi:lactoylglutathione lyase
VTSWEKEIGVIELFFEDLAAAKAFYTDVFGLTPDREDETSVSFIMGEMVIILLTMPAGRELVGPARVAGPDAGVRVCFTIVVPDVDAVCAELTERGVRLLSGPELRPWGRRTATFADPGGHVYEIAQGRRAEEEAL